MADINGVERTYANKDEYDWEGGEVDNNEFLFDQLYEEERERRAGVDKYTNTQEILESPEFQKEYNEWLDTDLKQERTDIIYQDWLEEYNREYRNEM